MEKGVRGGPLPCSPPAAPLCGFNPLPVTIAVVMGSGKAAEEAQAAAQAALAAELEPNNPVRPDLSLSRPHCLLFAIATDAGM